MSAPLNTSLEPVSGRVPSSDLDAEAAVISACFLDVSAADEAMAILKPEHFYADANRRIFACILESVQEGSPPDIVTVAALLRAKGRLDQVGGTPYLAQLADATPHVANVVHHARLVLNAARVRRACAVFQTLAAQAYGQIPDVSEWLQAAEVAVYEAAVDDSEKSKTSSTYRQIARETYALVREAAAAKATTVGYRTGFDDLDDHVSGLASGDLWFVAGRPGMGKTSLALQIGERVAREDQVGVIMLSAEMFRPLLMQRTFSREAEIPGRNLRLGRLLPEQWHALVDKARALGDLPIVVDDDRNLSPMRVRSKVRRRLAELRQEYGQSTKLGLVIIDYVQLMSGDRHQEQRATELGEISRSLKIMAGEFDCTFMVLSQLKRPDKNTRSKRPELSDLRDSGSLEADADVVLGIHREDAYRPPGEAKDNLAELLVLKGRNSGEGCHIVQFDGRFTAFYPRGRDLFPSQPQSTAEHWQP